MCRRIFPLCLSSCPSSLRSWNLNFPSNLDEQGQMLGDTIAQTVLGKPTVPEDTDNAPNVIAEGAAVNTSVGITAHSTFAGGSGELSYSLSADSSAGGFKIDPNTGVVTVADPSKIDFE